MVVLTYGTLWRSLHHRCGLLHDNISISTIMLSSTRLTRNKWQRRRIAGRVKASATEELLTVLFLHLYVVSLGNARCYSNSKIGT
jgi:hypothetical protein